jgi:signal peptidase I
MDKLKRYFLKIQGEFARRKPFFKQKIEKWEKYGRTSLFKQASLLLGEAEQCEKEIAAVFESTDWKYNRAFLKVKLQAFEGLIRELEATAEILWLKWAKAIAIITVVVFVMRNFVFGVYHVPTSSAENTFLVGDRLWGNKVTYFFNKPKAGEMVMFENPTFKYDKSSVIQRVWQKYFAFSVPILGLKAGPENMAKRVIAVPGDVIEGKIEMGKAVIYKNGKKLVEPYVNTYPLIALKKEIGFFESDKIGPIKIPDFLRKRKKIVLYSYDPKKDFENQPFYYIDYKNVLYDRDTGYMKTYKAGVPATNKKGKMVDVFGPVIVPEGFYWVMGDNRRNSVDSREWGFLKRSQISGKASFVIWSLDSEEPVWILEFIKNPFRFVARLRLSRIFKKVD